MKLIRNAGLLAALLLLATPAVADRLVLRNGRELTGTIVSETNQEIVIDIGDGMKMTVRRASVKSIERAPEKSEPAPEPAADPEPAPEARPDPEPAPEPESTSPSPAKSSPLDRGTSDFFTGTPAAAWRLEFGRFPELFVAKVTRFRAYELVSQDALTDVGADDRFVEAVRRHGHGGVLHRWRFRYVGNRELRFGYLVKFVGEISAPPTMDPPLIALEGGPDLTTPRIVVVLVKTGSGIQRFATTTTFTNRDIRVASLTALKEKVAPVRTYTTDYAHLGTTWLRPDRSKFLGELFSPFGDTARTRIARYRFRIRYFETPPAKRPALDPDRLRKDVVKPLARQGVEPASPEFVEKLWGNADTARRHLAKEVEALRRALATVGVAPGRSHYVEEDRIGLSGGRGITIETHRYEFPKSVLEELLRP